MEDTQRKIDPFSKGEIVGASRLNEVVNPINALLERAQKTEEAIVYPKPKPVRFKLRTKIAANVGYYTATLIPMDHVGTPDGNLTDEHFAIPEGATDNNAQLVAINLAEKDLDAHLLDPADDQIYWGMAWGSWRGGDNQNRVFVTFRDAGREIRYGTITGGGQDGSNKRWIYTFAEVEKTSVGYGGWTTKSGGVTGSAYNRVEDMNGASGLYGNGVDSANLTGMMDIQRAPNGVIVRLDIVRGVDGDAAPITEYWFDYENGIDGDCE